jgi:exopolyphosphatase/guanosine-5'-triphosphate,3'-diphosphate pyrophosphatase
VRVAVVDIGSNTARLLVATRGGSSVEAVREERAVLALGDEIERLGRISEPKLAETVERAGRYARLGRKLGCSSIEVIVTAPGRQSGNSESLVRELERATSAPVRVLSEDEEGRLAYDGAVGQARSAGGRIAVCDVGGGSTEVVFGSPPRPPERCCSIELGSLRLTRRFFEDDPPSTGAIRSARRHVRRGFRDIAISPVDAALATGGSARSLRRLAGGRTLGARELRDAIDSCSESSSAELTRELGLDPVRARTLLAGALILAEVQRRLGVPLEVARGGLREGAARGLLTQLEAA